ncbi:DUF3842 family protein [Christensenellaceae bacterium OttesenSCG-928-M15]|nr:DUF3842 family protein [Christensenellaceae bacterium OttesenSCG-928-M15]
MRIAIIDGQGGGVGCALVERLKDKGHTLTALGTNALATSAMLRAGANEGATGENAILYSAKKCDVITGPVGIICADALLGEVSPRIAAAVGSADARKVLIPSLKCNIETAGTPSWPLSQFADDAVKRILSYADGAS